MIGSQPVPCIVRAVCPTITTSTNASRMPVAMSIFLYGSLRWSAKVTTATISVSASPSPAPSSTVTAPALSSSDCRKSTVSKPSRYTLVRPSIASPSTCAEKKPTFSSVISSRRLRWKRPIHSLQYTRWKNQFMISSSTAIATSPTTASSRSP